MTANLPSPPAPSWSGALILSSVLTFLVGVVVAVLTTVDHPAWAAVLLAWRTEYWPDPDRSTHFPDRTLP